ncbi:unnamed protein product [Phytophthora fragariaefolia]|uniref:Unnamed protein product n=1 Tax=Phytophthora fragariaefolia TaxID=1490495 RepID=A0A9W6XNM1_9STRA|nr:unnamed protein product [Phytophthora fragariaefolia]
MIGKTELLGNAVTPVEVSVVAEDGERGLLLPTKHTGAVMLAATVTTARNGKAWILTMTGALNRERVNQWVDELGDSTTPLEAEADVYVEEPDARALVTKLLRVYRKLSANNDDCPPATVLDIEHHIDTGNASPIMMKRRRQAQVENKIVDENVTKMLQAGVIEEGDGAWCFPVVFGALLFTTLDLRSGYWEIRVAPGDKAKTAFTTTRGLYRFVRMPFGLTNAPSTFQRMMNGVLRGLTWVTCLVYCDDIVIFTSGGVERHVVELANVLERLAQARLTLKLRKCRFAFVWQALYHHYGPLGVKMVNDQHEPHWEATPMGDHAAGVRLRDSVWARRLSRQRAQEHVTAIEQSGATRMGVPGAEHEEMRTGSDRITTVANVHSDTAAIGVAPPTLQTAAMNENTGAYSGNDVQDREAESYREESSQKTRAGDRKRDTEETPATTRPLTRAAKRRAEDEQQHAKKLRAAARRRNREHHEREVVNIVHPTAARVSGNAKTETRDGRSGQQLRASSVGDSERGSMVTPMAAPGSVPKTTDNQTKRPRRVTFALPPARNEESALE